MTGGRAIVMLVLVWTTVLTVRSSGVDMTLEQQRQVLGEAQAEYEAGIATLRSRPDAARATLRDAAERFQFLIDSGVRSAGLHYDLANARLQSGELGQAILHYLEAQRLRPGDTRIENNLAYARSLRRDQIEPEGRRLLVARLLGWHRSTSFGARTAIFAVAWIVFWIAMFMAATIRSGVLRSVIAVSAVIWIACGMSLATQQLRPPADYGVIVSDEVTVRKGNGAGYERQFEEALHEGVEFELIEQRGDWMHIELPNGGRGWIPTRSAMVVTF